MQQSSKKISGKLLVIFFGIMILFTFFSRTFHYLMTPKVTFDTVKSGYIRETNNYNVTEFYFECDLQKEINVPYKLDTPIEISAIHVKEGDSISIGDKLISFDTTTLEKTAANLDTQLKSCEVQLTEFNKNYDNKIRQLNKNIEDYNSQIVKIDYEIKTNTLNDAYLDAIARRKDISYNIENIESELAYIKSTGILNGQTASIHQAKIDSLKNEIDRIMHLITGFSEIYSNISGTILSISYNKNDKYSGLDAILTIKPVDAPLNLVLKTNKDIAELLNAGISFKINIYGDEMETEVLKNEPSGTKHLIYTSFSGNANDITELDRVTIEIDSMSRYCDCIIPNSAFYSPNSVFVLRETGGFWGKEYYVESCEVVAGEYNYRESQIIRGIERGDLIVTGWDRGLKNGQRVVLPLN